MTSWHARRRRDVQEHRRLEGLPPLNPTPEEAYEQQFGPDRLAAQKEAAKQFWVCCGEPRTGPHHVGCHNYEEPMLPEIHPDQQTL